MGYMTKSWAVCRRRDEQPGFEKFSRRLREHSRPKQICFVQIMQRHNGDPSGVEFRYRTELRWSFVLPDASQAGYRLQLFDEMGFSGHSHFETLEEAVDEMVTRGFCIEDAGALDRIAGTPRWAEGMAWLEKIQSHNMSMGTA